MKRLFDQKFNFDLHSKMSLANTLRGQVKLTWLTQDVFLTLFFVLRIGGFVISYSVYSAQEMSTNYYLIF